jgi:hypothetical protein
MLSPKPGGWVDGAVFSREIVLLMPPKTAAAPAAAHPAASKLAFTWLESSVARHMREDFLAITLKSFRLHWGAFEAIAESIQEDLTAVHGRGWNVAIGRDVWRVLRTSQLTSMTLKCVTEDAVLKGLLVLAYKCSDDSRVPPVAAPLPQPLGGGEASPSNASGAGGGAGAGAGKAGKGKVRQDAASTAASSSKK